MNSTSTGAPIHASCVSYRDVGILILGDTGAGKSSLAMQLMAHGAQLVADDQVCMQADGDRLKAAAPAELYELIEMRGVGVLRVADALSHEHLAFAVELIADAPERMTEPVFFSALGVKLPLVRLHHDDPQQCAKVMLLAKIYPHNPAFKRICVANPGVRA